MKNKDYKISCALWIESQENQIKQMELQKEIAEKNISLNKAVLKNANESLKHEKYVLKKFLDSYESV